MSNSDFSISKNFKVYNTSIFLMKNMESIIVSNANAILNNLSSELPKLLSYKASSINLMYTENIEKYSKLYGSAGAVQSLSHDSVFYVLCNFDKFLSYMKNSNTNNLGQRKTAIFTSDFKEEFFILKDAVSARIGVGITNVSFLTAMIEFMLKEKDPKVNYVSLPPEIKYISYKIRAYRNSIARGTTRKITTYIYSNILIQMIKHLYDKNHTLKSDVKMTLPTNESDILKEVDSFKNVEIRSKEELNKMLVASNKNENDRPKPKFDLSLLNEEEQTMKEAINTFMIPYGNRYVYEKEADIIVTIFNKVVDNTISLAQLKAVLS